MDDNLGALESAGRVVTPSRPLLMPGSFTEIVLEIPSATRCDLHSDAIVVTGERKIRLAGRLTTGDGRDLLLVFYRKTTDCRLVALQAPTLLWDTTRTVVSIELKANESVRVAGATWTSGNQCLRMTHSIQ